MTDNTTSPLGTDWLQYRSDSAPTNAFMQAAFNYALAVEKAMAGGTMRYARTVATQHLLLEAHDELKRLLQDKAEADLTDDEAGL